MKNMKVDPAHTFVTSDHHFFSFGLTGSIMDGMAGKTVVEDLQHAELWNQIVGKDDLVLYVGDFCEDVAIMNAVDFGRGLNGHKILIRGNHDKGMFDGTQVSEDAYKGVFEEVLAEFKIPELDLTLVHSPGKLDPSRSGNLIFAHEHTPTVAFPTVSRNSFCCCACRHDWKPVRLSDALSAMELVSEDKEV